MHLLPQLLALAASLCFAACFVAAGRGLQYANPVAVTLIALVIQMAALALIAPFVEGRPAVAGLAVLLFVVVGVLMAVIRVFSFTGVAKIGAARASSLRATFPLFSVFIAITLLGESATLGVLLGTILVVLGIFLISWQPARAQSDARAWHVLIPLFAAFLAGVVHPIRRYALTLSNYPIWFAALVGLVALIALLACLPLLSSEQKPAWQTSGLVPVIAAGVFQTAGFLLVNIALGVGLVVHVVPIVAAFPVWVLVGTVVFAGDVEKVNRRTVVGTGLTVAGTIAIILG